MEKDTSTFSKEIVNFVEQTRRRYGEDYTFATLALLKAVVLYVGDDKGLWNIVLRRAIRWIGNSIGDGE